MTDHLAKQPKKHLAKPVRVIAITGGKGGVGKTTVSVNLGLALSLAGYKTYLLDADLGLANVDIMLGITSKYNLSHVVNGTKKLQDIIIEAPAGLHIIPASSGIKEMAALSEQTHLGLVQAFSELEDDIDILLVDTPAGISDNVLTFARAAQEIIVVICDEPTSITDAYALIKLLSNRHQVRKFKVLSNIAANNQVGRDIFMKLSRVCDQYLDVNLQYLGAIPADEQVKLSIRKQKPVVLNKPDAIASVAIKKLAEKIAQWPLPAGPSGYIEFFVERLVKAS